MGTYMFDKMGIVEKIVDALDDIEGDFTQKDLFQALEIMRKYPYVCDKIINDGHWKQVLRSKN